MNRKPNEPTLYIRPAVEGDLPLLNRISVASKKHWRYPEEWMGKWSVALTLTEAQVREQVVRVLEIDRKAAGFAGDEAGAGHYSARHALRGSRRPLCRREWKKQG